jgi:acyl carrier protein
LSTLKTKDTVAKKVKDIFHSEFGISLSAMNPDAHIFKDLGLDSIDAIDLAVRLEVETGLKLKAADLKSIRTFQDVVDVIWQKLQGKKPTSKK